MLQSSVNILPLRQKLRAEYQSGKAGSMIDLFSLGIAHALMALTAWRLMGRPELDRDDQDGARAAWGQRPDA